MYTMETAETMLNERTIQAIDDVIAQRKHMPGALLPILHGIQDALGYVPAEAVPPVAAALNLSRAEVHGVITYYHHFRSEPAGRNVVQVCRAESCKSMGSDKLWEHACASLKCEPPAHAGHGATSADGAYTVEPVYCLGLCASSPAIMMNDSLHARVSHDKFDRIVARETGAAKAVAHGSAA